MKTKRKNELIEPVYSGTVAAELSKVLAELEATDNLLESVESEFLERKESAALLSMRYRRDERVHAAYTVKLTAMPYQQTKIELFPYVEKKRQSNAWLIPLGFLLIFALIFGSRMFNIISEPSGLLSLATFMAVMTYVAIRYMEKERDKPAGYVEKDARLLVNSVKLALSQAETAEIDRESPDKEKYLGNMS